MIWVENVQLLIKSCPTVVTSCARHGVYLGIAISVEILQNQADIPYERETLTGPEPDPRLTDRRCLTCWEQGLPPGGKATGKCRARRGGSIFFLLSTELSQCAVTHRFRSLRACDRDRGQRLSLLATPTEVAKLQPPGKNRIP